MADLRAEQIMSAVLTAVTGLATTGANVERDRDYPTDADNSISVEQGSDTVLEEQGNAFIDSMLEFSVVAYVKKNNTYTTQINQIRKEVHIALMADRQLGLPGIVIDLIPLGAEQPEVAANSEKPVVRMPINFQVLYRHSITDASA